MMSKAKRWPPRATIMNAIRTLASAGATRVVLGSKDDWLELARDVLAFEQIEVTRVYDPFLKKTIMRQQFAKPEDVNHLMVYDVEIVVQREVLG